jgi:hypothetical protein
MSLFKKKKEMLKSDATPQDTLQSLQQKVNQAILMIGDFHFRKTQLNKDLAAVNDGINTWTQKAESFIEEAQKVQQKLQAEVAAEVEKGKAKLEAADAAPKAD